MTCSQYTTKVRLITSELKKAKWITYFKHLANTHNRDVHQNNNNNNNNKIK